MDSFVENTIREIRAKVGDGKVLLALSGGVDSSVAAGLLSRAIEMCIRDRAFDKVGIRGFTADYYYDYTCMETLQGLSASELSSGAVSYTHL